MHPAPTPREVPAYWLYGESLSAGLPDALHIEQIVTRSSRHEWRIAPHRHRAMLQLFAITDGGGVATLDAREHALAPASVLVIPPLAVHAFRFLPSTNGFVASLSETALARFGDGGGTLAAPLAQAAVISLEHHYQRFDEIVATMQAAYTEFATNEAGRTQALRTHAELLALRFARALRQETPMPRHPEGSEARLVARFIALVETDYVKHSPIEDYALALGVTTTHLTRCCRTVLGCPARRIAHDRLLLEARRRLVYTGVPVAEIAYDLGFTDAAYFSRFFSVRTGVPPTTYRARSRTGSPA